MRCRPDDFQVVEELGFQPDGDGEHDFLWLEKSGANTVWVAERLARFAGVPLGDVGFSGLKDRHATTRQWFSVRRAAGEGTDWRGLAIDGVRLLETTRNRRKLRRGAHRRNRFRIVLRDPGHLTDGLEERLAVVRARGVPNYFGEQRFGRAAGNLRLAEKLVAGARLSRGHRSLALSSARSWLFNCLLEERVRENTWDVLLPGDAANLDGSGSVFFVARPDAELEKRSRELDIHPTGPLWGEGDSTVSGAVAARERRVADQFPALAQVLETRRLKAARRSLRLAVRDLHWELKPEALEISFALVRGAFATAVLRELAAYADAGA